MRLTYRAGLPETLGLLLLAAPAFAATPATDRGLARLGGDAERVSSVVGPKVVQIATQSLKVASAGDEQPTGMLVTGRGRGSAFFVSPDGYLITNAHVVANASHIRVFAATPGDATAPREYAATVVGVDSDNDLALLKVDAQNLPFFELASEAAPRQGQLVLAYGSPMGLAQSASLGLISAVDRQLSPDDPRTYIQTDAPMNPGNSGGPLVDLEGRLIGVNTMILSQSGGSEGLGFAIPAEVVRRSYAALRTEGSVSRAQLGIQPRSITADLIAGLDLKVRQGVLVEDVDPLGPGGTAGLLPGDVLVGLNGEPIHGLRDLYRAEYALKAGTPADLSVMRGRDLRLLQITAATPPKPAPPMPTANVIGKDNLVLRLGIYGTTLTPALASTLGGFRGGPGVLVLALNGMNPGEPNVLEPGDVVHAVNGGAVDSVEALRGRLEAIPDSATLVLQVEHAGMLSYVIPGTIPGNAPPVKRTSTAVQSVAATRPLTY